MATREEAIRLSLIDNVTKQLAAIGQSISGVGAQLVKLNAAAQLAATGINAISGAATAFQGVIKGASDAQFQLAGLQAALGATPEELAKLDAEAKRVSETLGLFTKTEVLDALGGLGRAGLNAADALKALQPVINLATAGQVDLQFATDQTVNTLTQFGLGIEQAGALANGLVTAANASTTNVNALGLALSYAATSSRAAGNTLEETLEILAALAQTGLQGERAGTALRATFAALANEGSTFSKVLRESYGVTTTNLIEIIEQLRKSTDQGKAAFQALGVEAGPAIQGLVSLAVPQFDALREAVTGTGTAAEDATKKLADTYQAAQGRIVNILTNLRNELAAPILEPLAGAFEAFGAQVSELAKSEDFKLLGQAVAAFATDATTRIVEFVKTIDIKEATANVTAQLESLRANVETISNALKAIASTVETAFNAANVAFQTYVTAINAGTVLLASAIKSLVEDAITVGQAFGKNTDELEAFQRSLQSIVDTNLEETGASAQRVAGAFQDLVDSGLSAGEALNRLALEADDLPSELDPAAASAARVARDTKDAADAYNFLFNEIRNVKDQSGLDVVRSLFDDFSRSAGATSQQLDSLDDALFRSTKQVRGLGEEIQPVTLYTEETAAAFGKAGKEAEQFAQSGAANLVAVGDKAKNAAEDTKRLAQAFRDANAAGQFEGALDQFERLKAEGNLTAAQIAEIAKAADEAGKKFAEAGDKGEDGFNRVAKSAERASDEIDRSAEAAERQASSLESIFDALNAQAEQSATRNSDIQKQVDAQVEAATDSLEKQIELLERKLNLSKEELGIADALRAKYKLAEQEQIDRYAQLIARQRELNRERQEELNIVVATTSAAAGAGAEAGGGRGPNGRPLALERPRDTIGDAQGVQQVTESQLLRSLARLLSPELLRIRNFGG
jgi:TP901 family phage tail tape measure protein